MRICLSVFLQFLPVGRGIAGITFIASASAASVSSLEAGTLIGERGAGHAAVGAGKGFAARQIASLPLDIIRMARSAAKGLGRRRQRRRHMMMMLYPRNSHCVGGGKGHVV